MRIGEKYEWRHMQFGHEFLRSSLCLFLLLKRSIFEIHIFVENLFLCFILQQLKSFIKSFLLLPIMTLENRVFCIFDTAGEPYFHTHLVSDTFFNCIRIRGSPAVLKT